MFVYVATKSVITAGSLQFILTEKKNYQIEYYDAYFYLYLSWSPSGLLFDQDIFTPLMFCLKMEQQREEKKRDERL